MYAYVINSWFVLHNLCSASSTIIYLYVLFSVDQYIACPSSIYGLVRLIILHQYDCLKNFSTFLFKTWKRFYSSKKFHKRFVPFQNSIPVLNRVFSVIRNAQGLLFSVVLCRSLFVFLSFFFLIWHCLYFFHLRLLIIPLFLVLPNISFPFMCVHCT
jgi:hypothetical protein